MSRPGWTAKQDRRQRVLERNPESPDRGFLEASLRAAPRPGWRGPRKRKTKVG